jgi:hypothetical protein
LAQDACRKRKSELEVFEKFLELDDHRFRYVRPVVDGVAKNVVLCDDATLKRQEDMLEKYVDAIYEKNSTFLKAIVNPGINYIKLFKAHLHVRFHRPIFH